MAWHPTLESIERRPDGPQTRPRPPGSKTPGLKTLGGQGGCWCGETYGHDWAGKADGAPHPREQAASSEVGETL
jgi:hypothetical protein